MKFDIKKSSQFIVLSIFFHSIIILPVFYAAIPRIMKLLICILLLASLFYQITYIGYRELPNSLIRFSRLDDSNWLLTWKNGREVACQLLGKNISSRYIIILYFKSLQAKKVFSVFLLSDMLAKSQWGQLQIIAKFPAK